MRESHRWICNSWERGRESEANAPEDGRILNRVYENKDLILSTISNSDLFIGLYVLAEEASEVGFVQRATASIADVETANRIGMLR